MSMIFAIAKLEYQKGNNVENPYLPYFNDHVIASWWFQPLWKILVKMGIFPKFRGEHKKYLSCHHPDDHVIISEGKRLLEPKKHKKIL